MKVITVDRQIGWGDLDPLGIVFYPRYAEWIDASAHLFFESIGLSLQNLWQNRQLLFGLIETTNRYHQPGRYHQHIQIHTGLEALGEKVITLKHTIESAADHSLMVAGIEKRICLHVSDPMNLRAVGIPADIRTMLDAAYRK